MLGLASNFTQNPSCAFLIIPSPCSSRLIISILIPFMAFARLIWSICIDKVRTEQNRKVEKMTGLIKIYNPLSVCGAIRSIVPKGSSNRPEGLCWYNLGQVIECNRAELGLSLAICMREHVRLNCKVFLFRMSFKTWGGLSLLKSDLDSHNNQN